MRKHNLKVVLLVIAVLLSSIGTFTTYAVLKRNTGSITNLFAAANIYKLEYDKNGEDASGTMTADRKVRASGTASHDFTIKENNFTRSGYKFLGWSDDKDDTAAAYQSGDIITLTAEEPETILYAIWQADRAYTLTYDLNYTGAPEATEDSYVGSEDSYQFTVAGLPENFTRDGYVLAGWADSATATTADYEIGDTIILDAANPNKTIYAVWAEDTSYIQYSITFENNLPDDIAASDVTAVPAMTASSKNSSYTFTLSATPTIHNADDNGLVFVGWTTEEDSAEVVYNINDAAQLICTQEENGVQRKVNVTLYALWTREYYVTYVSTATSPAATKHIRATGAVADNSDAITLSTQDTEVSTVGFYETSTEYYKRQGYMLVGFSATDGTQTPIEHLTLTTPGRNNAQVVYAIWTPGSYALIYDANGGSGAPTAKVVNQAVTSYTFNVTTSSMPKPSDGAYDAVFLGWAFHADAQENPAAGEHHIDYLYNSATGTFTKYDEATGTYVDDDTLTLTEQNPSATLYAIWRYHYVLTYDVGYGDADASVPATQDFWTTAPEHTFTIAGSPDPTRELYEFLGFWSDTLDRQNGENRYYKPGTGEGFRTTVTVDSSATHKTIYARFSPLEGSILYYDFNGGSGSPPSYSVDKTSAWRVPVPVGSNKPTRSGFTFIGWAESPDADYTWLNSDDPDKVIYGGRAASSTNDELYWYYMNTDASTEYTLYAVWAPHHTIEIRTNYSGGIGGYRLTEDVDSGCDENWEWVSSYSSGRTSWTRTVTYDEYITDPNALYTFNLTGSADTRANAVSSNKPLYYPAKAGSALYGFTAPTRTTETSGNVVYTPTNITAAVTSGNGQGQNDYQSTGTFQLNGVQAPMPTPQGDELRNRTTYIYYVNAIWGPAVHYYRVVAVDPDTGAETELVRVEEPLNGGTYTTHTFPANTIRSPYHKTGYVCDFARTPNATTAEYYVTDVAERSVGSGDTLPTRSGGQSWYISQPIPVSSDEGLPISYDSTSGAIIYTLKLYPVWSKGQVFTLQLNYPNSSEGNMFQVVSSGALSREFKKVYTDSISYTKRAGEPSHTWPAGTAGRFLGNTWTNIDYIFGIPSQTDYTNTDYTFLGFSPRNDPNDDSAPYTVTADSTVHYYISTDKYQYYHTINQAVTIKAYDTANNVVTTDYEPGIPNHTMTLYAVHRPLKTYSVMFDKNAERANFNHLEDTDKETNDINLIKDRQSSTTSEFLFKSSKADYNIYTPRRTGYKLLGYSYTKAKADLGTEEAVDLHLLPYGTSNENLYYIQEDIIVKDDYAKDEYKGTYDVIASTNSAPHKTTMTVYAVWYRQQEYAVTFNYNGGTYTNASASYTDSTDDELIDPEPKEYRWLAKPDHTPTNGDYTLLGYSFVPVEPGKGTVDDVDFFPDENGYYDVTLYRKTNPDLGTVTINDDGVDYTNMTLYAVWGTDVTYYRIKIMKNDGTTGSTTLSHTESGLGNAYTFKPGEYSSTNRSRLSTLGNSRYGYRLEGLSYTPDGEIAFTITGNAVQDDVPVADRGTNVESTVTNNADDYTLTLYAVWVKQDVYEIVLSSNDGYIMESNSTALVKGQRSLTLSNNTADAGAGYLKVNSAYYITNVSNSNSNYKVFNRAEHIFAGYSYSSTYDLEKGADYTNSQNYTSSQYRQTLTNIVIDVDDPNQVITSRQSETDPEITIYTLTLYVAWQPQQYFEVRVDPNGGTFHNSSTGEEVAYHAYRSNAQSPTLGSYSMTSSYTDLNVSSAIRPGYKLLGYSYTPDGDVNVSITQNGRTVSLSSVKITRGGESGKTIETYQFTGADGGQIDVTSITLYAVWGIQLNYSANGGSSVSAGIVTGSDVEACSRTVNIPAVKPTRGNYIFLGWASRNGGIAEYGVEGYYERLSNETKLKETYTFPADTGEATLYAVWTQRFELYYYANGGDENSVPENEISYATSGQAAFDISTVIPTRPGYTFLGWAESADGPVKYTADTSDAYDNIILITGRTDGSTTPQPLFAVWQADGTTAQEDPANTPAPASETDPSTTPTEPSTTPTEPQTTPTEPSTTPTEPSTTPTEPRTVPTDPETTPTTPTTTEPPANGGGDSSDSPQPDGDTNGGVTE